MVTLHGVDRAGTEYECVDGPLVFDGPVDQSAVDAIKSWLANAVRVPLNEDCWLGINGVAAQYGGTAYRTAVYNYVQLLHQYGLYAELSLIWTAPGTTQATYQREMPDTDHSIALWQSVATTFKSDPNVLFGVYGEPHNVGWACWLNGGSA
ncbi:MAG: cellulase family glycosylhydrolase, partial [Polyangiaceae bacterium]